MGKIHSNQSLMYNDLTQITGNLHCLSSFVNGRWCCIHSATCITQGFPFFLSLNRPSNFTENI
jgi:hypothetical protein